METYYTLLGIAKTATDDEISAAYQRQRERYSSERFAELGEEFRRIAETRSAALDQAYAVLSDAGQRADYDCRIDGGTPMSRRRVSAGRLSRRDLLIAFGGALAGLLAIAFVWMLSGQSAQPALPPVGEVNKPAPDFVLPGLDGNNIRLSDYRGKVVLINFWGTWCEPCKDETPALQAAYRKLNEQGLVVIGIDLRNQERNGAEGADDVRRFAERYGITYPIALDVAGETARAFQIYPIPTSYFIDQNGTIRYVRISTLSTTEVEQIFQRMQEAKSALR